MCAHSSCPPNHPLGFFLLARRRIIKLPLRIEHPLRVPDSSPSPSLLTRPHRKLPAQGRSWRSPRQLHHLRFGNPVLVFVSSPLCAQLRLIRASFWITAFPSSARRYAVTAPRVVVPLRRDTMCAGAPRSVLLFKHGFSRGFLLAS
ncbi:hypothetical protein AVEN_45015-1 [Araneus ventricosus]|uniref:Uncharacterized protein n=1 Tax=Araneus ventricosus TaxID=182803 RepID=A0A4Y2I7J9_ARAVE|nr:hypothetical protein AVEN_45015-1 [Araneus ventricosus]